MSQNIFTGCIPALMTPCRDDRSPDFDALVRKGTELIAAGMSAVVYCGSLVLTAIAGLYMVTFRASRDTLTISHSSLRYRLRES